MKRSGFILSKTHREWPPQSNAAGTPRRTWLSSLTRFDVPRGLSRCGRLILIFFLAILLSPLPASSARKRIRVKPPVGKTGGIRRSSYGGASSSVKLRGDRRALLVTVSNMENLSSFSYKLTYTANGISQGVMGKIDPALEPTASRELLFGTCSAGVCTYHTNIKNMRLTISSHLKSGLTVVKPYRIKP